MKQKNNKPAISVIMAAYNSEKYIAEAIESILNQTFKDFEFIIINDKSTDKTLDIIKKYTKKDKRIKLIKNGKNEGLTKSLNKGLRRAKGKYIARMDDDDISSHNRFMVQNNFLDKNKDIFLVAGSFVYIDYLAKRISREVCSYDVKQIKSILPSANIIHHPTVMFRNEKKWFYRDKFRYAQDYDLWLRLLTNKKCMIILPECVLAYRLHKDSISSSKRIKQQLFVKIARRFYFERLKENEDNYSSWDTNSILSMKNELEEENYINETIQLKKIFKNETPKKFRKELYKSWRVFGKLFWIKGYLFFLISFFPAPIQRRVKTIIWGALRNY